MSDFTTITLGCIAAIVVLVMLFLLRRNNLVNGMRRSAAAAAIDDYRRQRDKADLSLVCPACGALAEPLGDTHNGYGCIACGLEFSDQPHEWKRV